MAASPSSAAGGPSLDEALAMLDATARLAVDPADPGVMQVILERAIDMFDKADAGFIAVREGADEVLRTVACSEQYLPHVMDLRWPPGEGGPGLVYQARRPLLWSAPEQVEAAIETVNPGDRAAIRSVASLLPPAQSVICAPLTARGEVIGAIQLDHRGQTAPFTEWELGVLAQMASNAMAMALDNSILFTELRAQRSQTQELLRRIIAAQEDERVRVARELHDVIAQTMTALLGGLRVLRRAAEGAPELEHLDEYLSQVDREVRAAMEATSDLASALRPAILDDLGLARAIEWQAQRAVRSTGVAVELDFSSDWLDRLPGQAAIMVFRIVQEALSNVVRHSGARQVRVEAGDGDRGRYLRITDDGVGLPAGGSLEAPDAVGLRGMRERAEVAGGELAIRAGADGGAEVLLTMAGPGLTGNEGTAAQRAGEKRTGPSLVIGRSGFSGEVGVNPW
ncbi:MAG: GAF domain-containing sensor histidine kinase [Bifidobacteriaceae bacterium]|jgi:signal transduction histidine kinase|nr:GAF domain-containing sensor histidine kinase [Bifidobacteriaceae bacterium]